MKCFLSVVMMIFILVHCKENESRSGFNNNVETTKIEKRQFYLNNISIGSKEKEVIEQFGAPDSIRFSYDEAVSDSSEYFFYEGLEIYMIGKKVYHLKCWNNKYSLIDNIKIGSSKELLTKVYGNTMSLDTPDGERLTYWVKDTDTRLFVFLKENKVVLIHFWFDYV